MVLAAAHGLECLLLDIGSKSGEGTFRKGREVAEQTSRAMHRGLCNPVLTCSRSSDLTLLPVTSSLSHIHYEHCFTFPYLLFPTLLGDARFISVLLISNFLGPLSDPSGLSLC